MSIEAATHEGVEEKQVVVGNTARNEMLAELAENARKERDKEILDGGGELIDTLTVPNEESKENPEPEAVKAEEHAKSIEPPTDEVEPPIDDYVTVKVDGVERQVPRAMVLDAGIRAVQKESAADQRLAEATRILNEAREQHTRINQPPPSAQMDATEIALRIRQGDDQQAAEAIAALSGRHQAISIEDITQAATAKAIAAIEGQAALQWFQTEYKDIVSDPYLRKIAAAEEAEMHANGDTRPYRETYKDIGDKLRAKVNEWRGGKPEVVTSTEKQTRKAEIVNLPAASVRQAASEPIKPKSTAQIIEEMRTRRGQAA